MALILSGDGVGYGCSTHRWYVFRSDCEECVALQHLCRVYGVTPDELETAIKQVTSKRNEEKIDKTSGFWYNGRQ